MRLMVRRRGNFPGLVRNGFSRAPRISRQPRRGSFHAVRLMTPEGGSRPLLAFTVRFLRSDMAESSGGFPSCGVAVSKENRLTALRPLSSNHQWNGGACQLGELV